MTELPIDSDRPPPASPNARRSAKRWVQLAVYLALTALVVYFVGRTLLKQVQGIDWARLRPNPWLLALGLAGLFAHETLSGVTFHLVLASFGSRLRMAYSTGAYWVGGLGRYVPGKLVSVAGSAYLLFRVGVRWPLAIGASFLHVALMVLVGFMLMSPLLLREGFRERLPAGGTAWAAAVVLGGAACLHPKVFLWLVNFALGRIHRPPIGARPANGAFFGSIAVIVLRFTALGAGVWFLARSLAAAPPGIEKLPLFVAAASAATVLGFLAVFTPAGLGIRELAYVLALGPVIGPDWAALLALVVRLGQLLTDVTLGLAGTLLVRAFASSSPLQLSSSVGGERCIREP